MRVNVQCESHESWEVFVNGHFVCRGHLGGFQNTEDLRQEVADVAPLKNFLSAIKKVVHQMTTPWDEKSRKQFAEAFSDGLHNVTQSFNVDIYGAKPTVIPGRPGDKIGINIYDYGWTLGRSIMRCADAVGQPWPNRWNMYWNAETCGYVSESQGANTKLEAVLGQIQDTCDNYPESECAELVNDIIEGALK
jgi:hypothetical protein